jgi:hypothetical protein
VLWESSNSYKDELTRILLHQTPGLFLPLWDFSKVPTGMTFEKVGSLLVEDILGYCSSAYSVGIEELKKVLSFLKLSVDICVFCRLLECTEG